MSDVYLGKVSPESMEFKNVKELQSGHDIKSYRIIFDKITEAVDNAYTYVDIREDVFSDLVKGKLKESGYILEELKCYGSNSERNIRIFWGENSLCFKHYKQKNTPQKNNSYAGNI